MKRRLVLRIAMFCTIVFPALLGVAQGNGHCGDNSAKLSKLSSLSARSSPCGVSTRHCYSVWGRTKRNSLRSPR